MQRQVPYSIYSHLYQDSPLVEDTPPYLQPTDSRRHWLWISLVLLSFIVPIVLNTLLKLYRSIARTVKIMKMQRNAIIKPLAQRPAKKEPQIETRQRPKKKYNRVKNSDEGFYNEEFKNFLKIMLEDEIRDEKTSQKVNVPEKHEKQRTRHLTKNSLQKAQVLSRLQSRRDERSLRRLLKISEKIPDTLDIQAVQQIAFFVTKIVRSPSPIPQEVHATPSPIHQEIQASPTLRILENAASKLLNWTFPNSAFKSMIMNLSFLYTLHQYQLAAGRLSKAITPPNLIFLQNDIADSIKKTHTALKRFLLQDTLRFSCTQSIDDKERSRLDRLGRNNLDSLPLFKGQKEIMNDDEFRRWTMDSVIPAINSIHQAWKAKLEDALEALKMLVLLFGPYCTKERIKEVKPQVKDFLQQAHSLHLELTCSLTPVEDEDKKLKDLCRLAKQINCWPACDESLNGVLNLSQHRRLYLYNM